MAESGCAFGVIQFASSRRAQCVQHLVLLSTLPCVLGDWVVDQFEFIVKTLLEAEGFWVRQSQKVELTKEEKAELGNPNMPRPEIDLVAYKVTDNTVLVMEVKSYLDSGAGVTLNDINNNTTKPVGGYKLLTSEPYRKQVLKSLSSQLLQAGLIGQDTKFRFGLALGHVKEKQAVEIRKYLDGIGWMFWSQQDIREKVEALADRGYENSAVVLTAKILLRGGKKASTSGGKG